MGKDQNNSVDYILRTDRIGLRNWSDSDLLDLHSMCTDPDVMRYFPTIHTLEQSRSFINRMMHQYDLRGYCYFAAELLETKEFIGFTGITYQDYNSDFTPCIDIGWRLKKNFWFNGLATEASKACLDHAFNALSINEIYSTAPKLNKASIQVMIKLSMKYQYEFIHPKLDRHSPLNPCVLYKIIRKEYKAINS